MQQAVHEIRTDESGMESPIECYHIRTKSDVGKEIKAPHYHEYIEFLYGDGECDVDAWVAGQTVNFKQGEMLIINSYAAHTFTSILPENSYICIKVMPDIIYSSDNFFFDFKYVMPFFRNNLISYQHFCAEDIASSDVPWAFSETLREWQEKNYGYEISLKSLILRIFLWTIRYAYSKGLTSANTTEDSFENTRLIQRSVEYINSNYADVCESEAAALVNMSYSHYSRQFKRVMGRSFCEYLNITRVNASERLLLTTDMSITEVALATGFATSSHFIENFKRLKGITPSKYRQIWTKKEK